MTTDPTTLEALAGRADSIGLLRLVIRLHVNRDLSEGQVVSASGLDRIEIRQLADERREERELERHAAHHQFAPHRKWPWFCKHCGYGPYEPLKHSPIARATTLQDKP